MVQSSVSKEDVNSGRKALMKQEISNLELRLFSSIIGYFCELKSFDHL